MCGRAGRCGRIRSTPSPARHGVFSGEVPSARPYRLRGEATAAAVGATTTPTASAPVMGEMDEYLLGEGTHQRLWHVLGAHVIDA